MKYHLKQSRFPGWSRREFLAAASAGVVAGLAAPWVRGQVPRSAPLPGERPPRAAGVEVQHPRGRVPLSVIIDDSTCLVNLNRFAIPQFAEAFGGERYGHDWRSMPVEIPDSFVRKFADWSRETGVQGKYSIVPFPALVGRVDRLLPGWTGKELDASLQVVRSHIMPHWDIHPEMVTHTIVVDTKTGLPYTDRSPRVMENWDWTTGRSVDELTDYLRYALTILKNADLPCEGITTPGGFGNRVLAELSQATFRSCREVFRAEIPHYFRHMFTSGDASVAPRVEYARNIGGTDPECVVSIIGCAGDWTGGWDCSDRGDADRFITADLERGRMVEVLQRNEPAIIVGHWTGIYFNGEEVGLNVLRTVEQRLRQRFGSLNWMKLSAIARYWAARELTRIGRTETGLSLHAPYACPEFTIRINRPADVPLQRVMVVAGDAKSSLEEVASIDRLRSGTCYRGRDGLWLCWDLIKGTSSLLY